MSKKKNFHIIIIFEIIKNIICKYILKSYTYLLQLNIIIGLYVNKIH